MNWRKEKRAERVRHQRSIPRDNPITELILKTLQVPWAPKLSTLVRLEKTIEHRSPLISNTWSSNGTKGDEENLDLGFGARPDRSGRSCHLLLEMKAPPSTGRVDGAPEDSIEMSSAFQWETPQVTSPVQRRRHGRQ
ncbi:hypothetical protein EYF80_006614 [Liparis tanakae]|uniref:Uncharacterized protein n=1 Tax=Liparis tanakae TaxID=230148 RepID=A0A4Z2IZ27_9TELE|nr:hypothetical protein EYF80_006614 [Liparis tanakae]